MKPIQRYNQGFGVFGPLEKCDTGKLAFYADMESEYIRLLTLVTEEGVRRVDAEAYAERRTKQVLELTDANERLQNRIGELEQRNEDLFYKADSLEQDLRVSDAQVTRAKEQNASLSFELLNYAKAYWLLFGLVTVVEVTRTLF